MAQTIHETTQRSDLAGPATLAIGRLRAELRAVRTALEAQPDVITSSDGALTVGVTVLDLLDREQQLWAELARRDGAPGRDSPTTWC